MVDTVTLAVVVDADRRLVIDLPASTPLGPAEVVIRSQASRSQESVRLERDQVRAKLQAAMFLTTDIHAPVGTIPLSAEDIARIGKLTPAARPSEDLIDDDRGSF